jgi:hypothetical protein
MMTDPLDRVEELSAQTERLSPAETTRLLELVTDRGAALRIALCELPASDEAVARLAALAECGNRLRKKLELEKAMLRKQMEELDGSRLLLRALAPEQKGSSTLRCLG